jgi:nitrogen fixation/metabolism regulation signal transduction histidine kinase
VGTTLYTTAFSIKVSYPLHMLVQGMTRLRGGKFDTRIRISTQNELAFLGQSFNEMAANIEALVKEVYARKLHEREAELTALQAQLIPHTPIRTILRPCSAIGSSAPRANSASRCLLKIKVNYNSTGDNHAKD